jgi:hypothetical protein
MKAAAGMATGAVIPRRRAAGGKGRTTKAVAGTAIPKDTPRQQGGAGTMTTAADAARAVATEHRRFTNGGAAFGPSRTFVGELP